MYIQGCKKVDLRQVWELVDTFLREWKCIDVRITWIHLKIEGICVTVVQVYAPTADTDSLRIKDEFFQKRLSGVWT